MKKAKWLEEATNAELVSMVGEILAGDLDEKEVKKGQKIIAELVERTPSEVEGGLSVEETLANLENALAEGIAAVHAAYAEEVEAAGGDDPEDEEDEEDEEDNKFESMTLKELKAAAKEAGVKGIKGMSKEDLIAALTEAEDDEDDEEDEDEEDEEDYQDMDQKSLKSLCRERGLKVNKSMKKADFIKLLEADDKKK